MILITAKTWMQYLHFISTTKTIQSKFHNIFLYCPLHLQLETTNQTIRSNVQGIAMKGSNTP
jgi:hypothetical protein